ncbi:phage portal protein [Bacillus sp. SH5-2]|uniref:phage portal protein n=1 Tax=Bacillus sp. SH5-2 TaxID=2217834 RepID=UPI001C5550A7|nr:phage portal protein [Bacillus sp. SH5-2]
MKRSTIRMSVNNPTSDVIREIIKLHSTSKNTTLSLYNRYDQDGLEIQKRSMPDPKKPNNKLPHDYRGYIINQSVGYLFGKPISYQIDKMKYDEQKHQTFTRRLAEFNTLNAMDDLDSELGKITSICGYAARLLYVDTNGIERVMNLNPWEVVFIQDKNEISHVIRYYKVPIIVGNEQKERTKVEWYDSKDIYFFIENEDGNFVVDQEDNKYVKSHMFDYVPVILFQNNNEEKGDFEKVEALIDAYDKNRSDSVNEVETFANAYMKFKGTTVDQEVIDNAKQTGAFEVPEDGDVDFITKNVNDNFVENTRKNLNEDIHKFSASVDMADEKFSGSAQTGESRKWKLIELENKAGTKARKFGKGLREQFKVLCSAWTKKEIHINYLDVFWEFKRNLPIDLLYVADFASKLKGIHSDRTVLEQIPYIDDVDYELQLMVEEKEGAIDLDNLPPDDEDEEIE